MKRFVGLMIGAIFLGGTVWATPSTFVDDQGVVRWSDSKKELCLFGTNYSVPFAYWEKREPIGADNQLAIDEDVYHIARLGLDGYRIHVMESYICNEQGNLIYNRHFQLFDYLLFKLKERGIKALITPMYLGGNRGFVGKYGDKKGCLTNPEAFPAQENYLAQFVAHVNPYTGVAYQDDPDIIAFEIVNEPTHFKRPDLVTGYINRMVAAIRRTGCEKPLFYNMTTSAALIDQILPANIQGGTFQWYPTGLTANHDQKGNLLPNVDRYVIPFADSLNRLKMPKFSYEFSPADVGASGPLYPAMARSFREAGFQFAAHFAYDPMHAAYCNVEYRTHFLNLAYTPKKSIGLMIASEAFHRVPLGKSYGRFPENNSFDAFRLSSQDDLAEMVTDRKFFYSNQTDTVPPNPGQLERIAGTGRSPVVKYDGTGAYFLDRLEAGVWRLEVMPDVVWVRDPFFVPDLQREKVVVQWNDRSMNVDLPDLGEAFAIRGLNEGNSLQTTAHDGAFVISPGSYLLTRAGVSSSFGPEDSFKNFRLSEFHAPHRSSTQSYLIHTPPVEVPTTLPLTLSAQLVNAVEPDEVSLILLGVGRGTALPMVKTGAFEYSVEIPDEWVRRPALLRYHIAVKTGATWRNYPTGEEASNLMRRMIYADDRTLDEGAPYQIRVVDRTAPVGLFDADLDGFKLTKMRRKDRIDCVPASIPGKSVVHLNAVDLAQGEHDFSVRSFCGERIEQRVSDLSSKTKLTVYGQSLNGRSCRVQVALLMKDGTAYGGQFVLSPQSGPSCVSLSDLVPVRSVLLPRPYPSFHSYWFRPAVESRLDLASVEGVQISIGPGIPSDEWGAAHGVAIGWITLE